VARKYLVETFGCQMNMHDGERIAGLLEADGYVPTTSEADADLIVLNTCSVRERAEDKLYNRLGEIRRAGATSGHRPQIAVAGCVAQQEGEKLLKRNPSIDVIVGTQATKQLPALLALSRDDHQSRVDVNPYEDVSFPLGMAKPSDPVRAWVTIIEGCNEFCSFCVVPYTRGHERMRPVADILAEARRAAESGRLEIQLLGQIVNHYQAPDDPTCDFPELLRRVSEVEGLRRIRFASPHPRHASDRLIEEMRTNAKLCRHFHLPVQSGSNRVLKDMRRRYTREDFLALVQRLRASIPGIAVSTDVIVGFPGETEDDFQSTMSLVSDVRFQFMYSFKYSPRPNTLAEKRMTDDVPEAVKARRIVELQQLQGRIQREIFESMIGQEFDVLVDGHSRRRDSDLAGKTDGWVTVNFPGSADLIGRMVTVRVTESAPNSVRGEMTGEAHAH
jgi:tRNA-2-methylthio-N6-dimethylallyladenosine synthase